MTMRLTTTRIIVVIITVANAPPLIVVVIITVANAPPLIIVVVVAVSEASSVTISIFCRQLRMPNNRSWSTCDVRPKRIQKSK